MRSRTPEEPPSSESPPSFPRKRESSDLQYAEATTLDEQRVALLNSASRFRGNDPQGHKTARMRLGEITDSCLGKMLDKEKNRGIYQPYLANINVRWGGFELSSLNEMRFESNEEDRYGLKFGDLVVCEGGEPGRCAIWREERESMKFQKALHRLRVKDGYSTEFLFYRMLLAARTGELANHFIGSTIKHLTGIGLAQVEFEFPELAEQQEIAAVLSALDAKIDLNHRINAELEALAKTIYDYWFVQFDFPDAHGRPYKSSGGAMVWHDTLKREIPAGWDGDDISAVANVLGGATPSKLRSDYWGGDIPFFTPTDACGNIFQLQTENSITQAGLKNCNSDLFGKGTVFITARGSVGKIAVAGRPMAMNQSCYALAPRVAEHYPYVFLHAKTLIHHLKVKASGSTFNSIVTNDIEWTQLISPKSDLISAFCKIVAPMFERIEVAQCENRELTQLRDWLLPLLMNGQVRVA